MSRGVGIVFLLLALPAGASAQGALNDQQRVGQQAGGGRIAEAVKAALQP